MAIPSYDYLSRMPHFSFLPEAEIAQMASKAIHKGYPEGTVLAVQGKSKIDHIYVVTEGSLSLYLETDGEKKLTGFIKAGEVFGGITILLNAGVSLRTVIIDQASSGYLIPQDIFLNLCARFSTFYEYFLENFSKNIFDERLASIIEIGQTKHFLSGVIPFSFLPEEQIDQIVGELKLVKYPENTILFAQGANRVGYLYILQKGCAERYLEENNKKTMSNMLGEGDTYGGISMLLNDGIAVRTLRVAEESYFYLLAKQRFIEICEQNEAFTEYFTDIFGKHMLQKSYAATIAKTMRIREDEPQILNQPVSSIYNPKPIFGEASMSIQAAAQRMQQHKISSLLINDAEGDCVGIVTEKDMLEKVIAAGQDITHPLADIMSTPVRTLSSQSLGFEALMAMMQTDIRHLAITDTKEKVVGILSNRDILAEQGHSHLFLLREISEAGSLEDIISKQQQLPKIVRTLIASGAKAGNVTRFITTVSDAILDKLICFALDELKPPPVKFAFMILGSEGRREQTLKTDQDNAIIYEDVPPADNEEIRHYFLKLGRKVCTFLDQAGYAFCKGDVMAQNPKWCQPISQWKAYFSDWIHTAEGEDLLQASIFFDFRAGYGEAHLIDQLRAHLFESLEGWSGFFRHLTENALHFKPPLGFFRNFLVESRGKHHSSFDIKSAMTPMVDFARIYALKNKIEETNTLERVNYLRVKEALKREEYEEFEKAYSFLMQLRFVRQVTAAIDENEKPNNYINPKKLTRIEQKMLKEIFKRIEKFQTKLEFEFIGIV
jgi:CBS domain-containing protein